MKMYLKKEFKLIVVVFFTLFISCEDAKYAELNNGLYVDIHTNKGDILVKLYPEQTPLTVSNFISLIEGTNPNVTDSLKGKKYYEGLLFHRVMNNFMIQGGDPKGNGSGGPGYVFGDEFPKNAKNELLFKHDGPGVLSMANYGVNKNGSQFFITHKDTPWLDGKHTVFGKTVINTEQLNVLKTTFFDEKKLQKAIDSLRMVVVNTIERNDTILSCTVVRKGSFAKKFNAADIFVKELDKYTKANQDRVKKLEEKELIRLKKFKEDQQAYEATQNVDKAVKTASGLKVLTLKKGNGKKVTETDPISMHYTISLANGKKIQSTVGKSPFVFTINAQPMMQGFKEGVLQMKSGGKARLFIPYYIGYGENGGGPFPPKADLIFELEILKVGK